jgi:hypothetical protein
MTFRRRAALITVAELFAYETNYGLPSKPDQQVVLELMAGNHG